MKEGDHIARDPKYHIPRDEEDSYETGQDRPKFIEVGKDFSLPPFGLATLKLRGNLLINPKARDPEKYALLYSAAGSWLKQVGFDHKDYRFFKSRC